MSIFKRTFFMAAIILLAIIISGESKQNTLRLEKCAAISRHELIDQNGDIWEVLDDLDNRDYSVLFDDNNTKNIEDDIVLIVF